MGSTGKTALGRGALTNTVGRFERHGREAVDDGWDLMEDLPPLRTEVTQEVPRSVITRNTSPDISFDRSINPYRGCEHGCVYCFARPSHAYLGLSPGLDFETKLIARPDAPRVLEAELRRASYRCDVIAIGTNTDAYQPIERDHRIQRIRHRPIKTQRLSRHMPINRKGCARQCRSPQGGFVHAFARICKTRTITGKHFNIRHHVMTPCDRLGDL